MNDHSSKQILIYTCLGYLSMGIVAASLGPLLSQFAANNHATLAQIGGMYTAYFIGALLANVALGRLSDLWGQHRALTVAFLIFSLAMTATTFSRWLPLTFGLIFIAGIGYGTANLCGNVLIGRVFKENHVSAVNWLNVFYGVGAFTGPILVSAGYYFWKNGAPSFWLGSFLMLVVAVLMYLRIFQYHLEGQGETVKSNSTTKVTRSLFLWSLGLIALIYVGTETSIGGWSTTYLEKTTSLPIEIAALVTSAFWLALTGGRLMGALLGSRVSAENLLWLCLGISSVGGLLFVFGYGNGTFSIIAIMLIGLGFGAIYPTIMAVMTNAFPQAPGQAGGVITALCSIGGSLFPWMQGVILQNFGMRSGTYFVAILLVLLIGSFLLSKKIKTAISLN